MTGTVTATSTANRATRTHAAMGDMPRIRPGSPTAALRGALPFSRAGPRPLLLLGPGLAPPRDGLPPPARAAARKRGHGDVDHAGDVPGGPRARGVGVRPPCRPIGVPPRPLRAA